MVSSYFILIDFGIFPMLNCVIVMQNKCGVAELGLIMRNAFSLVGNGIFVRLDWKLILTIIRVFATIASVIYNAVILRMPGYQCA